MIKTEATIVAFLTLILFEGMGRFLVRSINASVLYSCILFITAEPQARSKIPITEVRRLMDISPAKQIYPNAVVKVTNKVILILVSSDNIFNLLFNQISFLFLVSNVVEWCRTSI
jgi:hypothetical protein